MSSVTGPMVRPSAAATGPGAPGRGFLASARRYSRSPLTRFLLKRTARGLAVLGALSVMAFAMIHLLPGNPAEIMAGPYSTPAARAAITRQLGLDSPLPIQYFRWLGNILHGDFGTSLYNGLPVSSLIASRLPNTAELAVAASLISVGWGVPVGAFAAVHRGRLFDWFARGATFLGLATPVFAFGVALVLLAATVLPTWPTFSFVPLSQDPVTNLQSLLLPSIALGLPLGATICRFMRAELLQVYEQDFMRTALATGGTRLTATLRHGLRNASGPVVTLAGLQLAGLIGNSILIENVFAIPGIGQLTVTSISQHDYAAAQACILVLGAVYVLMNLLVDLALPLLDPKVGAR